MSIHPLDAATRLAALGDGRFAGATSPAYANIAGPFGGATAATLLNAAMIHPDRVGDPVALTVNFCGAIADGAFEITARAVRSGKYTQHWSLELTQDGVTLATATALFGARGPSFSHQPGAMPPAPRPESVPAISIKGLMPWLEAYEFRFVEGAPVFTAKPFDTPQGARSLVWVRDHPARRLDFLSLAAISDNFFLRLVQVRGAMGPMGTVTLTTYFHATAAEIAAQGDEPLLGVAEAKRFHANFHDQHMELWGRDGTLLATGVQVAWFKS